MNSLELMELIGEAKGTYVMDAQQCREGKRKIRRLSRAKIVLIAAAMALLLAGCTYAVLKLQELRMPITTKSLFIEDNGVATYPDNVSMQGYAGSRNYLAAQEWYEFEKDYDKDFSLMRAADAARYLPPDAYWAYGCYTQTMIDKVNEICKKYHLELMGAMYIADDPVAEMFSPLGIDGVLSGRGNPVLYNGYYYGSGSFFVCGTTRLGDSDPIDYQLICNQKSAFSITGLNMEDIEAYTQWDYVMEDGTKVLLALNGERAVILVDREDSFVTVNVTQSTGLTVQMLEDFADTFDFSFRVIRPDPPAELIYEGEPTEFAEPRPQTTELEFWGEGMAYPEPATLHRGEG